MARKKHHFTRIATAAANWSGSATAFYISVITIVLWTATGPFFHFSDAWQLVINTVTNVVTLFMVFLIQNAQNRDTKAIHLKLNELIRSKEGAHTTLLEVEELDDQELDRIRREYAMIAAEGRRRLRAGESDTNQPKLNLPKAIIEGA